MADAALARSEDAALAPPPAALAPASAEDGAERRARRARRARVLVPALTLAAALGFWEWIVFAREIPPYVLPAPSRIATTLVSDWNTLFASLLVTLTTTAQGLLLAFVGGVGLAILFALFRPVEYALYPYAVILQVTPVIAIAPLLLIYLPQQAAVLACAWIVAFFPILSNATLGLRSVDHNLLSLFELYRPQTARLSPARRVWADFAWELKVLWHLKLKAAAPYILGGLRIGGGLALIGAVVAEIAAGSAGAGSGLAYRIAESQYRLNIARLFAALALLALTGVVIFLALTWLTNRLLSRWHESARERER